MNKPWPTLPDLNDYELADRLIAGAFLHVVFWAHNQGKYFIAYISPEVSATVIHSRNADHFHVGHELCCQDIKHCAGCDNVELSFN